MADGSGAPVLQQRTTIFVYVPAFGDMVSTTTSLSILELSTALNRADIPAAVTMVSNPELSESRNMATTLWYDSIKTTHMLMVDADMGFAPDLVLDMLAVNEPLVGTLYRKKRDDAVLWAGSGFPMDGNLSERAGKQLHPGRSNFLAVEAVGMGVTLIRRDCITAMLEQEKAFSDPHIHGHCPQDVELQQRGARRLIRCFDPIYISGRGRLSEDLSFCYRHRACGGHVWAAIGHDVTHIGKKAYAGSFLDHQLQIEALTKAETVQ